MPDAYGFCQSDGGYDALISKVGKEEYNQVPSRALAGGPCPLRRTDRVMAEAAVGAAETQT